MQVTETLSQGLKREFKVVLPTTELEQRLTSELATLKDRVRINGFRPGKVPVAHLRRVYGRSVMADVVQNAVNEANRKIVEDNNLKLAFEPQVQFPESKEEVEQAMDAKARSRLHGRPRGPAVLRPRRRVRRHGEEAGRRGLRRRDQRIARADGAPERRFEAKQGEAVQGDRVTVDFVGRIDGAEFEGGKAEDIKVEIGSNTFIPGFEDQLVGVKAGDEKLVKVTFPVNYMAEHLAGKDAEFDVTVKEVAAPGELKIDDELAKGFGMESLDKLKDAVRERHPARFRHPGPSQGQEGPARRSGRQVRIRAPPSLVEQEFAAVWSQVEAEMKNNGKTFADEGTTEDEARAEYRKIAERRVRLGLVLAQIGEKSDIKVSDDEVTQALVERVRQYPGQERQAWEFYRKNPQALAEIRAPLFEEKVVDHILSQVKVVDEPVSKEALFADDEADEAKSKPRAKAEGKKASKSE